MSNKENVRGAKNEMRGWSTAIIISVFGVLISSHEAIEAGSYSEISIFSGSILALSLVMALISLINFIRVKTAAKHS